jgi:hypothetical protein
MRHASRDRHERLDSAEAPGASEEAQAVVHGACTGIPAADRERDHPSRAAHLPAHDLEVWMALEPGVEHALDPIVLLEEPGHLGRSTTVRFHAYGERAHPTEEQEGRKGVEDPAERAAPVLDACDRLGRARHDAADQIAVAAEILGRAVQHEVHAELDRALQDRCGERAVDGDRDARAVRDVGRSS